MVRSDSIVKVPVNAPPSASAQRAIQLEIEAGKPLVSFTAHTAPTTLQQTVLMRQSRKKPIIAKDEVWSLFTNKPPPFPEAPIKSVPFMDCGISPAFELQKAQRNKKAVAERDRLMATPSVEASLCSSDVPLRHFETTSRAEQQKVLDRRPQSSADPPPLNRRCMPEKLRSQIDFGNTLLEAQFLDMELRGVAQKCTLAASRNEGSGQRHHAGAGQSSFRLWTPSPVPQLKYARRSASSLGNGCIVSGDAAAIEELTCVARPESDCGTRIGLHNLRRSNEAQEAFLVRKHREAEFGHVVRIPRPAHRPVMTEVFCLR